MALFLWRGVDMALAYLHHKCLGAPTGSNRRHSEAQYFAGKTLSGPGKRRDSDLSLAHQLRGTADHRCACDSPRYFHSWSFSENPTCGFLTAYRQRVKVPRRRRSGDLKRTPSLNTGVT